MIISIRKFLLVNLLISIVVTTGITAIGNYILDQKDIQYHLDTVLSQSGLAFMAILGNQPNTNELNLIQKELNSIPDLGKNYYKRVYNPFNYDYEEKFQFQIWDKNRKLLIHSANAPLEPFSNGVDGFSNQHMGKDIWRVFTTRSPTTGLILDIAERYDIRSELSNRMARDDLYIMLLVYPLLGLNIWLIIGKGLDPLRKVADEVSHREPHFLDPVDLSGIAIEIKPLVDELNHLFLRLQQALDREKRFAADAAHELRTPLAALKTQVQLALKVQDPQKQLELLQKMIFSVDRSAHIVQQLLTLSRIVPEEVHTLQDMGEVDLHKLTVEEITVQVPHALEKNIDIELDSPDHPIMIEGNATALSIMLRNLVDNAIRYNNPNGLVSVKLVEDEDEVVMTVTDTGPGIPAELRSRVFERFYRILGTKQSGSGLGLAIIQQIAILHQAKVKLGTPENGQGLQVTVTFPKKSITTD